MLNFPIPYPDELIYSTIARYGVHFGITSPKQLLDEVFSNRKVIATADLPCHLKKIAEHYPSSHNLTVEKIIYQHTLFPIYAPFVTEERRQRCLSWMADESKGAIHLSLGVAASRIKQIKTLRYCPGCLKEQLELYGEYYWKRSWQIAGADCCQEHGMLMDTELNFHNYHRHNFEAASPQHFTNKVQPEIIFQSQSVTRQVIKLLSLDESKSPEFDQWTKYYRSLSKNRSCNRGGQINYEAIKDRIINHWTEEWLNNNGLNITDEQTCWLRSIFRKHRKSFSYLEHIVVLDAFIEHDWDIAQVIKKASSLSMKNNKKSSPKIKYNIEEKLYKIYRKQWLKYLLEYGTKQGRLSGGGAVYAWLYRHDQDWLKETNEHHRIKAEQKNNRVNWAKRDRQVVKQLFKTKYASEKNVNCSRRSRNWYLSRLEHSSTIENNLNKLKMTNMFFEKYSEDIPDYQIRRINRAAQQLEEDAYLVIRWRILRLAGLSEERLTSKARSYLNGMKE